MKMTGYIGLPKQCYKLGKLWSAYNGCMIYEWSEY